MTASLPVAGVRAPAPHGPRDRLLAGVDPLRWPDVATVPGASRPRVALTGILARQMVRRVPIQLCLGHEVLGTGPRLEVHDAEAFLRRLGTGGLIGFGESYMAGEWDAPDLAGVLTVLARHVDRLIPRGWQQLRPLWAPRRPRSRGDAVAGARRDVSAHYDLSDNLFALFLDETMTYSSACFAELPARRQDLAHAQVRKVDRMLDLAGVGPGTRLLEVGTGWGTLALRAGRRGARVVTVTLSEQQRAAAARRVRDAGLGHLVSVLGCDYRQVRGTFDAIVSVEMIEAVGEAGWPTYFATLRERLAPGGTVALQAITMPHGRMVASRGTHTWIQKYIFPGGQLPSMPAIHRAAGEGGLAVTGTASFGAHYAETLRLWREEFMGRSAEVDALGFDGTFRRMWELYLAHSEAGFRAGYLDVHQLTLTMAEALR